MDGGLFFSLGVVVQTLTPDIARRLGLDDVNANGVLISSVNPSSRAAATGIEQGDIILSINQRATRTPEDVAAAVAAALSAGRDTVLLLIRRGNTPPARYTVVLVRR